MLWPGVEGHGSVASGWGDLVEAGDLQPTSELGTLQEAGTALIAGPHLAIPTPDLAVP